MVPHATSYYPLRSEQQRALIGRYISLAGSSATLCLNPGSKDEYWKKATNESAESLTNAFSVTLYRYDTARRAFRKVHRSERPPASAPIGAYRSGLEGAVVISRMRLGHKGFKSMVEAGDLTSALTGLQDLDIVQTLTIIQQAPHRSHFFNGSVFNAASYSGSVALDSESMGYYPYYEGGKCTRDVVVRFLTAPFKGAKVLGRYRVRQVGAPITAERISDHPPE